MEEPSKELEEVFSTAAETARKLNHEYVTIEHVLFSMLSNQNFIDCVNGFGADAAGLRRGTGEVRPCYRSGDRNVVRRA